MRTLALAVNLNQRLIMVVRSEVTCRCRFARPLPPLPELGPHARQVRAGRDAVTAWLAELLLVAIATSGCTGWLPAVHFPPEPSGSTASAISASHAPGPRALLPFGQSRRLDFNRPGSVAAAFFTAWASVDTLRGGPNRSLARCADLVTPGLKRQLATRQAAPAGWRTMRAQRLVSVVHVQAVTVADGAPAPRPGRVYLSVYARRITTTTAGRTATSDGITLLLIRHHERWLVAQLLFY
jgi:hypothetical protein